MTHFETRILHLELLTFAAWAEHVLSITHKLSLTFNTPAY